MIHVFFHIATIGPYQNIIDELLIDSSDLIDKSSTFNACIVGSGNVKINNSKINIIHLSNNIKNYEYPTLQLLHSTAQTTDGYFCYFHTKGASNNTPNVCAWRSFLSNFNLKNYNNLINHLQHGYDTAGVDIRTNPTTHYSGNFWWANSSYIKTLPIPKAQKFKSFSERYWAEFWLCSNNGKFFDNYNTNNFPFYKQLFTYNPYTLQCHKFLQ